MASPLGRGGLNPVIHVVGCAAQVSDFSAVYHGTRPLGIIMVCSVQDPRQQKQAVVAKKKQCQQSYPVPTYRRTTPRFPESLYANKHAQAQPSGERLGQASWPFAVDAADEGRTKLFLTADSAPRWMRDRKGIGRVVFRQPPVFDWMSGNFSVTPGF